MTEREIYFSSYHKWPYKFGIKPDCTYNSKPAGMKNDKGEYLIWHHIIPKHFLDEVEHEVFTWRANPNKTQKDDLVRATKDRSKFRILLINVEGFATPKVKKYTEAFIKNSNL